MKPLAEVTHAPAADEAVLGDIAWLARTLNVSPRHVQALDSSGRLGPHGIHLGRSVRYRKTEVMRWITAGCPSRTAWQAMQAGSALLMRGRA